MSVVPLDDLSDARLDPYRGLKVPAGSKLSELFIAEGQTLVNRLLTSDFDVESCLVVASHLGRIVGEIPPDIPIYVISKDQARDLTGYPFHRGIMMCGRRKPSLTVREFLSAHSSGRLTLAICEDIADPENLGSLIRISAALGAQGMLLSPNCCDPFSRRALRVSMGTGLKLPLLGCESLPVALAELRDAGLTLAGTILADHAIPLAKVIRPERIGVLFGNEGQGLSAEVVEACTLRITIPMREGVDSLNVAVAAGIILHHLCQE